MARVYITGVAGFLGSHLAERLIDLGHTVWGNDSLIGGDAENVPRGVIWDQFPCQDRRALVKDMDGAEILVSCAATAHEGLSVFSPHTITDNIFNASVAAFSAAITVGVERIVFCSSMARYGKGVPPFDERDRPAPQDPYGIAKVAAEDVLRNLAEVHNIEYAIAVPHNIIGPRQKYDDPFRNVASIFINLMLQERSPVIYGDGTQTRCFSYVDDCLSCLEKMIFGDKAIGEVINIGPDEGEVTINELYSIVAAITGYTGAPVYMPARPQEVHTALCSSDKARRLLGYQTTADIAYGLRKMTDHIRERGPKPFRYHLPLEIVSEKMPKTWRDRLY